MSLLMSHVTPMLQAKSIDETITFYTNILGFAIEEREGGWCCLEWGGAEIMFYETDAPEKLPTMTGQLYFYPEDVKSLWERLKDRAAIEWELQAQDYGMLDFGIRDCNGYILSFGQSVENSK